MKNKNINFSSLKFTLILRIFIKNNIIIKQELKFQFVSVQNEKDKQSDPNTFSLTCSF